MVSVGDPISQKAISYSTKACWTDSDLMSSINQAVHSLWKRSNSLAYETSVSWVYYFENLLKSFLSYVVLRNCISYAA